MPILEYERRVFRTELDNNSFTGEPRPELDDAWHELLKSKSSGIIKV